MSEQFDCYAIDGYTNKPILVCCYCDEPDCKGECVTGDVPRLDDITEVKDDE